MPTSYNPNLGVLSAFQGMGNAMSQVGQIGLTDALETRRSKMENELRQQLKKEDQDFIVGQSDVKNERDVAAAKLVSDEKITADGVQREHEMSLQGKKNEGVASAGGKRNDENKGIWQKDGVVMSASDMTTRYAKRYQLDSDSIAAFDREIPSESEFAKDDGWTLIGSKSVAPPTTKTMTEAEARKAWAADPNAKDMDIDSMVEKFRKSGMIVGEAPMPEPGFMNAMASDADPAAGNGQFAGGAPQGKPKGVLDAVEEQSSGTGAYSQMGASMQSERNANSKRASSIGELLKNKSKITASSARDSNAARSVTKKEQLKIQKVAKKARAALDKGTINQVSKANLQLALNDSAFVDSLSEAEIKMLRDYLGR